MKAMCVDHERIIAEDMAGMCLEMPEIDEIECFDRAEDALAWTEDHPVDLILMNIRMSDKEGLALIAAAKTRNPEIAVIYYTAEVQGGREDSPMSTVGYFMKPISMEALEADLAYALSGRRKSLSDKVFIKTFGNFDVFVNDKPVSFKLAKSKEILAYLVDKQGSGVKRAEIFAAIWEERFYDRKMQKQLDTYIRSLRQTLKEYGLEDIMEMKKGILRVKLDTFSCDAYLFFSGDTDAINSYRGEYMSSYSWASMTESILYWKMVDNS